MTDDSLVNLYQYFEKLKKTIENNASFKFMNKRFVEKQRIDDILCCIDINFPEPLKVFRQKFGDISKDVRCFNLYQKMINNIKIPILGNSYYAINYSETLELIERTVRTVAKDYKHVTENYPTL